MIKKFIYLPFRKIRSAFVRMSRYFYLMKQRKRLTNTSFSLFSSNCLGGCVLHDLGLPFSSPFVNLFLNAKDYIKYLQDPHKYNQMEFEEVESEYHYPVGKLGDLTFHFVHYATFDEAVATFKKRLQRINFDDIFVIFSERDGCTHEDLLDFDNLPYENKIVFTHLPYEDIKSAFYIKGFENEDCLGDVLAWDPMNFGRKIYHRFDFVEWFNKKWS